MMLYLVPFLLLFAACGEDDGDGGGPDLLLGFSGVVIFCLIAYFVVKALRNR